MANIQITVPRDGQGGRFVVDGVDLSHSVLREGISIDLNADPPRVTAVLSGAVEITLPDGVAVLHEGEES